MNHITLNNDNYRKDISLYRAIAVIAVFLYHIHLWPNGYLGVDIFFVISGYLITLQVWNNVEKNNFSITDFLKKRFLRIYPLLLIITLLSLILGCFILLPNELETVAQNAVASLFSSNNVLMSHTASNYWNIANDYKPLMHTWSLGIEIQYYICFAISILLLLKIKKTNKICLFLLITSIVSLLIYILNTDITTNFYMLPFRWWQFGFGGLAAIYLSKSLKSSILNTIVFYSSLFLLIFHISNNDLNLIAPNVVVTALSVLLLSTGNNTANWRLTSLTIFHPALLFMGTISYSIYLWHQVIIAFIRNMYSDVINERYLLYTIILTFLLSTLSYYFIEQPFRKISINKRKIIFLIIVTVISFSISAVILFKKGIISDIPSMDVFKQMPYTSLIDYNENVRTNNKLFDTTNSKIKILIIGNSYGRDAVNILENMSFKDKIQVAYYDILDNSNLIELHNLWHQADKIIYAAQDFITTNWIKNIEENSSLNFSNKPTICIGTKFFGASNGKFHFNYDDITQFDSISVRIPDNYVTTEQNLKQEWKNEYISLIDLLGKNDSIKIFTSLGNFITHDGAHLTPSGAQYIAQLIEPQIAQFIFN